MRPKRAAAIALLAVALAACKSEARTSSETDCHDVAKGHNCVTVTETSGSDRFRVVETWVYTPDAPPVVDGLAPVHRSEWVATIDCETRASQFDQARFWDAQERPINLSASQDSDVRRTLTANVIPPLVTAICNSTS